MSSVRFQGGDSACRFAIVVLAFSGSLQQHTPGTAYVEQHAPTDAQVWDAIGVSFSA